MLFWKTASCFISKLKMMYYNHHMHHFHIKASALWLLNLLLTSSEFNTSDSIYLFSRNRNMKSACLTLFPILLFFCYIVPSVIWSSYLFIVPSFYEESYKITLICLSVCLSVCLSLCQFGIYLRNGSLVFFLIFCTMVDNWSI